jgi:hypothetical protein
VKYLVGLIQEQGPDGYNIKFLRKRLTCWIICFPEIEDTAVIDPSDTVLKSPHPMVSRSICKIVTTIFCVDLSGYNIN